MGEGEGGEVGGKKVKDIEENCKWRFGFVCFFFFKQKTAYEILA